MMNDQSHTMGELHLQISGQYQAYKDLADRCLINPQTLGGKGDRRVFYLKPRGPFLRPPREQNKERNEFLRQIGEPPRPEGVDKLADDMHQAYVQAIRDRSSPELTKEHLARWFRRRLYKLQHKKYKLLLRWAHYCLTSDIVDQVSLKFSPALSKVQFEQENCVKRGQRLEGDDHFGSHVDVATEESSSYNEAPDAETQSAIRTDDIEVYLRYLTYEEQTTRLARKFLHRCQLLPLQHRHEIFRDSAHEYQKLRNQSIQAQLNHTEAVRVRGKLIIETKKLGESGNKELEHIVQAQHISKL
jgi:hypothetical protein